MIRIIVLTAILVISKLAVANNPIAEPGAQVIEGNARFTVMTDGLIRLEWSENSKFEDRASLVVVNRNLSVPEYSHSRTGGWLEIKTSKLLLKYKINSGIFKEENLSITTLTDNALIWYPGLEDTVNLGGTSRTLDGMNGGYDWEGKPLDLGQGVLSRNGWFLLDDSKTYRFDGNDEWNWVSSNKSTSTLDWYFFSYGSNYKRALKDYTAIAGKIPIPPKFAFGYWWSRYWVYSDEELKSLMTEMREYDIPIDVLVVDMDWHLTHGGLKDIKNPELDPFGEMVGWTGYTWNKDLFPEPEKFLAWTENFNLKTALNLHPASGIPPMESQYESFAAEYGFDTSKGEYIPYKMGEKRWAEVYFDKVLHPLENDGVDFWWLDWQQFPTSRVVDGLSNTWWLNYTFFTDMEKSGKRPLLFHRWGGLGNHRYQIGFSGDDKISWESLNYQSYFTATASNVGYGYWSHDIGGHSASELGKDPELYTRWIQFGIFSPIFRTHSAKISSIERRFWMYPDHFSHMRDLVKLRYELNPYIYSSAKQAYDTGISIVRPMYYDFPKEENAYAFKHQYAFGDNFIMAPIAEPISQENLLAKKDLWLPEGEWFEWSTGEILKGNTAYTRHYAIDEYPLFAKAGSIIPMYPSVSHLQQEPDHWELTVIPGDKGETDVYTDDGASNDYQGSSYATTRVQNIKTSEETRTILVEAPKGKYKFPYSKRSYEIKLLNTLPPKEIKINGKVINHVESRYGYWEYDGRSLATIIKIPHVKIRRPLTVDIHESESQKNLRNLIQGKVGKFKRVSRAVLALKEEAARENWWATLPDLVLGAEQTPTKIQYRPEEIITLLQAYDNNWQEMLEKIQEHADIRSHIADKYIRFLTE